MATMLSFVGTDCATAGAKLPIANVRKSARPMVKRSRRDMGGAPFEEFSFLIQVSHELGWWSRPQVGVVGWHGVTGEPALQRHGRIQRRFSRFRSALAGASVAPWTSRQTPAPSLLCYRRGRISDRRLDGRRRNDSGPRRLVASRW